MLLPNSSGRSSDIVQLIYYSHISDSRNLPKAEQNIQNIVSQGRSKNRLQEITSVLLTDRKIFAQVIEGPVASVDSMYSRLLDDQRHHGVEMLQYTTTYIRLFPSSAMAFVEVDRMPCVDKLNDRSTPMDRRKACISVLKAFRPLLL